MADELNDAIASAVSETKAEVEGTGATVVPDKVETAPAESEVAATEPAKEEAPVKETKPVAEPEESFSLSAAQLEKINKDPELRTLYRGMVKGFTAKTTALAETRKSLEEKAKVADWIQSDPDAAVETLARMRGKTFAQAKNEAADKVTDGLESKWAETVGPEAAKLLRPLFEETAKQMLQSVVDPIRQQTEELQRAAAERGIAASVQGFGASRVEAGEEWDDEIQTEMAELMNRVSPGDETPIDDYLSTVYDAVQASRNRKRGVKTQLDRLRKAQADTEPTTTSRPAPRSSDSVTVDMDDRTAIAMATKLAQQEYEAR